MSSLSSTLLSLRVFYFMHFGAMGVYLPYFPAWLEASGIDGFRMSVIVALLPLLSVLSPSGFGVMADTLGLRGSLLRWSSLGAFAAFVVLSFTAWRNPAVGFWLIFFAVLAFGFFRTPMQLMGDVVALEQPADYARVRMWGSIGFMLVAPIIGRWLPLDPPWLLPAAVAAPLLLTHLASFGLPARTPLPSGPAFTEVQRLFAQPGYSAFLWATLLGHGGHVAYELCISLHLRDLGVSGTWIGLSWTLGTFAEVVLMAFSKRWTAGFSATTLLCFSLLVSVGRWLFLSQVTSLWWFLAFQPLHAVTFGLRWIASMTLVKRFASLNTLATSQGLFLTATATGQALGMLSWGSLYKYAGSQVFLAASVVSLAASAAAFKLLSIEARANAALRVNT